MNIISLFGLTASLISSLITSPKRINNSFNNPQDNFEVINVYDKVLSHYYKEFISENPSLEVDYATFQLTYEASSMKINDFLSYASSDYSAFEHSQHVSLLSSSVVEYTIGTLDSNPTDGSRFKNGVPLYNAFDYSYLKVGDIILEDEVSNFRHVAAITSLNHEVTQFGSYNTYIQTIEAVNSTPGVQFGYLDDQRILDKKIKICRFKNSLSSTQTDNLLYFLKEQLGKIYSLHSYVNSSIYSSTWYCTELIRASYNYIGIDIAPSHNHSGEILLGTTIYGSSNMKSVYLPNDRHLSFKIVDKVKSTWVVDIFNPLSKKIAMEYNSKMCFQGDAENWTLKDIKEAFIKPLSFVKVTISENWFATHIVASYKILVKYRNERIITSANNLSENGTHTEYKTVLMY